MMRRIFYLHLVVVTFILSCNHRVKTKSTNSDYDTQNFLTDFPAFTTDSLINVVIEIPAGTSQKWEVNKSTGQIAWEQISPDSFRVINYLPYPANYGFVPQTLLSQASGGDGDPVDVFVLGASINRERVIKVKLVGIIHMLDGGASDSKLLAINTNDSSFDAASFEMLNQNYPGVVDILKIWLTHYKGPDKVKIISLNDEKEAIRFLKKAHLDYFSQKTNKN